MKRKIRNAAIVAGALLLLVTAAALIVVNTNWFRNYVRDQIISATEDSTGGKVTIGSFDFDVWHLRAVVTNFVIHGTEPAGAQPFVQTGRLQVDIRLFTSIHHILDIAYLDVERPQVNVMVLADGRTNIPEPRKKSTSKTTPLETVVDLAIGHFELTNGMATLDSRRQPLNIQANNLHVQLYYNVLNQGYQGQLELEPLYVVSGRNTPVTFKVTLPLTLQKDRIDFHHASITTAVSSVSIDGDIENMNDPRVRAHMNGHVALIDIANGANLPLAVNAKNVPADMDFDVNASAGSDAIDVTGLRATFGRSNIEASGRLKGANNQAGLQFRTQLALGELGRLAKLAQQPAGSVTANGVAHMDASNNYDVGGSIQVRDLSFEQGKQRIAGLNLVSAVHADPHTVELKGLKLSALGGEFEGNISLEDFERYKLQGSLRNFDIDNAARALGETFPYDGVLAGAVDVAGDTGTPGARGIEGNAHLTLSPGKRGIPVSGRIDAGYHGVSDNLVVQDSFIALPHSRLTLSGSVGNQLNVTLTTHSLADFVPGTPVVLTGGANFAGAVTGGLSAPRIAGHLAANQFSVEGRQFATLGADVEASSNHAAIRNGTLTRGPMSASFAANLGLHDWSAPPRAPLAADISVANGDLADVMALAGQPTAGYSGALTALAQVNGTVGNPQGSASLQIGRGALAGEPFDQIQAQIKLTDQLVTIPAAYLQAGAGRIDLTGEFRHPRESFTTGTVRAHLQGNQIDLSKRPNSAGTLQVSADMNGNLDPKEFLLTSLNADASARGLRFEGQNYGDLSANAKTAGQTVTYRVTSNFAGSNLLVNGNTRLVHDYPTVADATVSNLPVERLLVVANRSDIPARGSLSATAHLNGTYANPQGSADVDLTRAVLYNEPLDHVHARVTYLAQSVDVPQFEIAAGPSRIDLTAHYDHPVGNLQQGSARFNVTSSHIDLARIHNVQSLRPGLAGTLDLSASGAGAVHEKDPYVLFSSLNANVAASGISAQGHSYGNLKLTAATNSGNQLSFALDSDLAGAAIHGKGTAGLAGDYPVNAQLTFGNVAWTNVQSLLQLAGGQPPLFEAMTDGEITISGPVMKTDQLNGALRLNKLNLTTLPRAGTGKQVTIVNQGPVSIALEQGQVRIQNAHLTGPDTDIQVAGTASIKDQTLNATVNANADVGLLKNFDRDIYSSGKIMAAATVRGTIAQPLINGQMTLQNAAFNYSQVPVGISNANGVILFNGNSARVQSLTAEAGGGRVNLTGFAGFGQTIRFGLRGGATNVRVRVQEGVSITADADIRLTGTADNSVVSGTATINQVNYAPQSDIGSILTRAAPPVQAPSAPSPLLDNMKLDIRVRTSSSLAVQAALAENLQADADLRVRGTAAEPGVLGRVTVNEGQLVFFGAQYTVNTGTISFYNPVRIEPVLDISLETQAQGVTVTLRVTGPIDDMKLSYTSDPALQFQEIVALLAAGSTPTSDPTLLANQPQQPAQGFQQMGESAVLGKALADPVASRLQRVFGLTQFKIDPSFTTGSSVPTASLTLQQRITSNLTFTYVSAINDPNSTTIRIEWAFTPRYSAVATRDLNGIFSINFFYKRQFR